MHALIFAKKVNLPMTTKIYYLNSNPSVRDKMKSYMF